MKELESGLFKKDLNKMANDELKDFYDICDKCFMNEIDLTFLRVRDLRELIRRLRV